MTKEKLKETRKKMDMSQAHLAHELGVSQTLVSQMERGASKITRRTEIMLKHVVSDVVRRRHYIKASEVTGRSVEELEGERATEL